MATHRNLVAFQKATGEFVRMDSEVEYDGPPNWKFEPLDPEARAEWEVVASDPARVAGERAVQERLESLRAVDPTAESATS